MQAHKRRLVWAGVLAVVFVVIVAGVSAFVSPYQKQNIRNTEFYVAKNANQPTNIRSTVIKTTDDSATVRIEEGPRMDDLVSVKLAGQKSAQPGDRLLLSVLSDGSISDYATAFWRIPGMVALALLFIVVVFLVSGRRGMASLVGLAISIGVIIFGLLPAILAGANAFWASVGAAFVIAALSVVTAHGVKWRTIISLLSIFAILALAIGLAILGEHMGNLTGIYDEASALLQIHDGTIDMRGILIGGIIIATLGVLDDVVTTQTATIDELQKAQPKLTVIDLIKHGMSVGNEHVVALVNTLALAYVGVSLPTILSLIANSSQDTSMLMIVNSEFIAQEVVRTLVSGMALVAAVPIATIVAAIMINRKPQIFATIATVSRKKRRT